MTLSHHTTRGAVRFGVAAVAALLLPASLVTATMEQTWAAEIVSSLLRLRGPGCGPVDTGRDLANTLVKIGPAALSEIQRALGPNWIQQGSPTLPGKEWLMLADCKIEGPSVFPKLRRMIGHREYFELGETLDRCAALSLGLTSYLSSWNAASDGSACEAGGQPRNALDRLILVWEGEGPRAAYQRQLTDHFFEESLGPHALAAYAEIRRNRTWATVRSSFWRGRAYMRASVGYRFQETGIWSNPIESLEARQPLTTDAAVATVAHGDPFHFDTSFTNAAGESCGEYRIDLVRRERPTAVSIGGPAPPVYEYTIDNSDLEGLLRLISFCGSGGRAKP